MKYLVTGATGNIGSGVTRCLLCMAAPASTCCSVACCSASEPADPTKCGSATERGDSHWTRISGSHRPR
ncbi:hypothetical protein FH620_03455 [Corallococcus exiguus]|nr:hypothetical protein FH620_03455 [Corallococcus exiguus]